MCLSSYARERLKSIARAPGRTLSCDTREGEGAPSRIRHLDSRRALANSVYTSPRFDRSVDRSILAEDRARADADVLGLGEHRTKLIGGIRREEEEATRAYVCIYVRSWTFEFRLSRVRVDSDSRGGGNDKSSAAQQNSPFESVRVFVRLQAGAMWPGVLPILVLLAALLHPSR